MFFTRGQLNQVTAALSVCLINISIGLCGSWTSLNIESWLSPDSPIPMSVTQSSWVVSIIAIGSLTAVLPSGMLANVTGRKVLLLGSAPLLVISWTIIVLARSVEMLCVARFIQGLTIGTVLTVSPLYLGEIADINIRGFIGTLYFGAFYAGELIEYVVGAVLPSGYVPYFNITVPIVFVVLFLKVPESPYYLMIRGDKAAVTDTLEWLRVGRSKAHVLEESAAIEEAVAEFHKSSFSASDILSNHQSRKALLIVMSTAAVRVISGGSTVISLASYIFKIAGTSFFKPGTFAILIGAVQFLGCLCSAPSVDNLGRRFLLMWSILVCCFCEIVVGIYFYLKITTELDVQAYNLIVPVALSVYYFFLAVGTGSLVGVLKHELFPINTRGLASALCGVAGTTGEFMCLKFYMLIAVNTGIYWNHFAFAVFAFYGFLVYFFLLPETKGRTFQEIQDLMAKKPKKPKKPVV